MQSVKTVWCPDVHVSSLLFDAEIAFSFSTLVAFLINFLRISDRLFLEDEICYYLVPKSVDTIRGLVYDPGNTLAVIYHLSLLVLF